jgi:hypothetical protein
VGAVADTGDTVVPFGAEEKPDAVAHAERSIRQLALGLTATGVGASALWVLHVLVVGLPVVPMAWLGVFLVALVLFFFFPQTRGARLAREVLRQWDDVQVRGLLEASGASTDPRLQAAETMGRRIAGHPGATEEMRRLAADLVGALRHATRDQRLVEVLLQSRAQTPGLDTSASLRDSLDYLDARAGKLLGALAELHSAVVKRDAEEVARVLDEAAGTLAELEALDEIERHLGSGES